MTIDADAIRQARDRLDDSVVRRTPVDSSRSLDEATGATAYLKMEHLQRTGSFKIRGAQNKLSSIARADHDTTSVVAASAGNHAQGVALAASKTGLEATVVMPKGASQAKIEATTGYGADVVLHGSEFRDAMAHAQSLVDDDSVFVHAYDDPAIVAGQGTVGLEILDQVPDVETVLVPIGGGGLMGGIATAIADEAPDVRVVGVQADGAATVSKSLREGEPWSLDTMRTIADGIATGSVSDLTYGLIETYVDEVVTVTDTEITESVLFLLERSKQLVEAAGATTVAAILSGSVDVSGETVVPVLSGGNLGLVDLQSVLTHGLTNRDQLVHLRVLIEDAPGEMSTVSGMIGDHDVNIHNVRHVRSVKDLDVGETYLDFRIATSGLDQTNRIIQTVRDGGYQVSRLDPPG